MTLQLNKLYFKTKHTLNTHYFLLILLYCTIAHAPEVIHTCASTR